VASKGLGLIYESCGEVQQKELISNLVGTLMTGKRCPVLLDILGYLYRSSLLILLFLSLYIFVSLYTHTILPPLIAVHRKRVEKLAESLSYLVKGVWVPPPTARDSTRTRNCVL